MADLNSIRFETASRAADAADPAEGARLALSRIDTLIEEAPGRDGWECARGCAACCHLLVRVTAGEADAIAEHLRGRDAAPESTTPSLLPRLRKTAHEVEELSAGAYRERRVRCAFLDDGDVCSIYAHRPVMCRVHASRSATACADVSGPIPLDGWLGKIGEAVHAGLGAPPTEELHRALATRLAGGD